MDRDEGPWMGAIGQGRHNQDGAFCIELIGLLFSLGGFWLRGILARGDIDRGDIDRGDFGSGGICPRGILSGGILSGGILSGGVLSRGILSCHRLIQLHESCSYTGQTYGWNSKSWV